MASGNMIVTLVAQTRKWSSGLQRAGKDTMSFGSLASKGIGLGVTALIGMGVWLGRVIPQLAQMGAESRKADVQLRFMIENMDGVGAATEAAVKQMADYANKLSVATGIEDEQIKAVQRKMLMFKSVRKSADEMGGSFDRATSAAIDLAAGGFGSMETNAVKLGKMLESPTANLNALNRAGVVFTDQEKKKITVLAESGKKLEAQDFILGKIEERVKGLAVESSTPFERMSQQFRQMGDTIGEAMLPALEKMNARISLWLSSPQGKKDLEAIVQAFVSMAESINAVVGFVIDLMNAWRDATDAIASYNKQNSVFRQGGGGSGGRRFYGSGSSPTVNNNQGLTAPIINFNAPIDSVSAGRELSRVLADYQRAAGRRV